jgi:hypothetical protein
VAQAQAQEAAAAVVAAASSEVVVAVTTEVVAVSSIVDLKNRNSCEGYARASVVVGYHRLQIKMQKTKRHSPSSALHM